uniref:Uncharacterized protein n=1 Tax=Nelumbo nucifera TaxID=4432 RepID=A0A822Z212_NELNU|nr:TPA_asm: hypothetical protein HUJ06_008150 [Nelumbo nucifera]
MHIPNKNRSSYCITTISALLTASQMGSPLKLLPSDAPSTHGSWLVALPLKKTSVFENHTQSHSSALATFPEHIETSSKNMFSIPLQDLGQDHTACT